MNDLNAKIIVVTHKDYIMPTDNLYLPICVGIGRDRLKDKFQADNIGDNISDKNSTYCELTAIYWAWKNLKADYVGIAHYRRHFTIKENSQNIVDALTTEQLSGLVETSSVIVPKAKKYPFSSLKFHYINSLKGYNEIHKQDLQWLAEAIAELHPKYMQTFESVINGHHAHMLNMYIMRYELFNAYCEWMFSVINKVVEKARSRDDQNRYAGALSEFLLEVWLIYNKLEYKEVYLLEMEKQRMLKKVIGVLKRKLM